MNFKSMSVLFIIIVFPIILVLSLYQSLQISTLNAQIMLDEKLTSATYDAIKAYNLNAVNNMQQSNATLKIRDINASINTFMSSLSVGTGSGGQVAQNIKQYIPALVYVMYDGYYMYTPSTNKSDAGLYEHTLKPYVYYTVRYINSVGNTVVIKYTLDNFVSYYAYIGGVYKTGAGYLEPPEWIENGGRKYNGISISDTEAISYYAEAREFTEKFNREIMDNFYVSDAIEIGGIEGDYIDDFRFAGDNDDSVFQISGNNNPHDPNSKFSGHRKEAIRISIQNNLALSMELYNSFYPGSYPFQMPILTPTEWEEALSNVTLISFMQGQPIGMRYYNGYSYITSTLNREFTVDKRMYQEDYVNQEAFESINTLYFIDEGAETYHKIDCTQDIDLSPIGYKRYLFEKILDPSSTSEKPIWRYRNEKSDNIDYNLDGRVDKTDNCFNFGDYQACYYCIINSNYVSALLQDDDLERTEMFYNTIRKRKAFIA